MAAYASPGHRLGAAIARANAPAPSPAPALSPAPAPAPAPAALAPVASAKWDQALLGVLASSAAGVDLDALSAMEGMFATHFQEATLTRGQFEQARVVIEGAGGAKRRVTLELTKGEERSDAIDALVAELAGPRNPAAAACTMSTSRMKVALAGLYKALTSPTGDAPPVNAGAGGADLATALADANDHADEKRKARREFSMARLVGDPKVAGDKGILGVLAKAKGERQAPKLKNLVSLAQLRLLEREVVEEGHFPYSAETALSKLKPLVGADGLLGARAAGAKTLAEGADAKDAAAAEAAEAKDAASVEELKARLGLLVHSVGVLTTDEHGASVTYEAALDLFDAVDGLTKVRGLSAHSAVLSAALERGRELCNESRTHTVAQAFAAAAEQVKSADAMAATLLGLGLSGAQASVAPPSTPPPPALPPVQPSTPATLAAGADAAALTAAAGFSAESFRDVIKEELTKLAGAKRPRESKKQRVLDASGKHIGWSTPLIGGNPGCKVKCRETHGKDAECHYNHDDK
jgi:hypothetical protein